MGAPPTPWHRALNPDWVRMLRGGGRKTLEWRLPSSHQSDADNPWIGVCPGVRGRTAGALRGCLGDSASRAPRLGIWGITIGAVVFCQRRV
uniref:Uncharacterized protein n=1 Tax=Rhodococcus hoagii TaxID=43767 RepID=A0A1Z1UWL5_RHOHA|nr:hypothetical protein pVAPN1204_00122 [Prescottella equi]ARX59872.1 hypothetical protein pVAPN1354_1251 [Prescottella equi]ARX60019.1 hypothetical protein pVAPN1557_1251 [Prescottella equi]